MGKIGLIVAFSVLLKRIAEHFRLNRMSDMHLLFDRGPTKALNETITSLLNLTFSTCMRFSRAMEERPWSKGTKRSQRHRIYAQLEPCLPDS
jgi:hypothetical protein